MANKKITVVGDGAEQFLTPEEEHRLEVKVDQMLDPNVPDGPKSPEVKHESKTVETTPQSAEPPKPKVTKIVTKFDDDEPTENPKTSDAKAKPAIEVEPAVVQPPKSVAKKITIKHHEDEVEEPKKPVAKHTKTKTPTKKTTKKLKVTIADGSEPESLDAKADAITAAALAAEEQLSAPETPKEESATLPPEINEPEPAETSEDAANGAPPLILKHSAPPIGTNAEQEPDAAEVTKPAQVSTKIAVLHDDSASEPPEVTEEAALATESSAVPPIDIPVEEEPEKSETIAVEVESKESVTQDESTGGTESKKYRPPDGPLQFKRAEVPIQPHKPGEPRVEEKPVNELSEDEAITQAFESKATEGGEVTRKLFGGLAKVAKITCVLAIVAGVIAVGAIPSLRHKALKLAGQDTNQAAGVKPTVTNSSATTTSTEQDIYIAKRAGIYNVYRAKLDGQQEQLVLAGTGKEASNIVLAPNSSGSIAALVSTRDGKQNQADDTQQTLTLVTVSNGATVVTDTADQVKLVDWFGDYVVYVLLNNSTSTTDTNRYQIVSYNVVSKIRKVLEHTTYLNDVLSAKGLVYYATATAGSNRGKFVQIQPDGSDPKTILSAEIAAITRTSYDTVILSGINKWYSYQLGGLQATPTSNVSQESSRHYVDSPDGKRSVYVNAEGASPQLKVVDTASGTETKVAATEATYPIRWLGNATIVFRNNGSDYSVKLGGQPAKVADVFDAAGISLWHEQ